MLRAYRQCVRASAVPTASSVCGSVRYYCVGDAYGMPTPTPKAYRPEPVVATTSTKTVAPTCRVRGAAYIQRWPTINAAKNEFEELYMNHWLDLQEEKVVLDETEFERFDVKFVGQQQQQIMKQRRERDRKLKEKEEEAAVGGGALRSKVTKVDEEKVFKPASRRTPADHANDRRSLSRKLMGAVTLVVKDKATGAWRFPVAEYDDTVDKQDLQLTAHRKVKEDVGTTVKTYFIGKQPVHWVDETVDGELEKTFFFYGRYVRGDVVWNPDGVTDHAWVSNAELTDYFSEAYVQSIQPMLREFNMYPHPDYADLS